MSKAAPPIAILDYRMGNLRSVQKSLQLTGANAWIATAPEQAKGAAAIVLPGVGAFADAMDNLIQIGFLPLVQEAFNNKMPLFGICVGMQILFDEGEEMGLHPGLGLMHGQVVRFRTSSLVVPHVGWNQIHLQQPHFLTNDIADGSYVYFTHSYYPCPVDPSVILATTDYGVDFASFVAQGSVYGIQFHPEKSWLVGLQVMKNFVRSLEAA